MVRRLKILLTGSNGYLGSYLTAFLKTTNFEITKFSRADINLLLNLSSYKNYLKKHSKLQTKFDVIIHTASLPYKECNEDPDKANIINNLLTEKLSNYCLNNNCLFIFFSSVQVYGTILDGEYYEDNELKPDTVYGISKAKAEQNLINKFSKKLIKGSILRIGNIVGLPTSHSSKGWNLFANYIIKEAFLNKKIVINNPYFKRNFLPIDLLMNVIKKIINDHIEKKYIHIPELMNITLDNSTTLLEYSKLVSEKHFEVFNQKVKLAYHKNNISQLPFSLIKNSKLRNYFSSTENYSLDQPIVDIFKFLNS